MSSCVWRARKPIQVILVGKESGKFIGEIGVTLEQQVAVGSGACLDRLEICGNYFIEPLLAFQSLPERSAGILAMTSPCCRMHDSKRLARGQDEGQGSSSSARKAFRPR